MFLLSFYVLFQLLKITINTLGLKIQAGTVVSWIGIPFILLISLVLSAFVRDRLDR